MVAFNYWFDIPTLCGSPFLAINAANNKSSSVSYNAAYFAEQKTGDWTLSKAIVDSGLEGKLVLLFYSGLGGAKLYVGTVESVSSTTNVGPRQRYVISVVKRWREIGTCAVKFSTFLAGVSLSAQPTSAWVDADRLLHDMSRDRADGDYPNQGALGTNAMREVAIRVGHQIFARGVRSVWNHTCALSGITERALLQACHLVPWGEASPTERTCADNGLLLCGHLHLLLDAHLISFANDGNLLVSRSATAATKRLLAVTGVKKLRRELSETQMSFVQRHRERAITAGHRLSRAQ